MKLKLATAFILISYLIACNKSTTPDVVQQAAPTITSFAPTKDTIGGNITISGTNFSTTTSENVVKFNGIVATIISASTTKIVVKVPSGLTTGGPISVTIAGQSATSSSNFRLLSTNEVFIIGNWTYKNSVRSDTVRNGNVITYASSNQVSNFNPILDYLIFTDSGKVYSAQSGWGVGFSGVFYKDTINYTMTNNKIFLSYPAGINSYGTGFTYQAYQDTINIKTLTNNSFSYSRYYHSKHWTFNSGETKLSIDSLIK
jgi:hypothetical protein